MAIKRLHEGFGIDSDSCISGIHPMRDSDPPGLYLGVNPEMQGQGLFITYWEACEIAHKIGYPMPEVYEAQQRERDDQARRIAELEAQLHDEVHNLQMKAVEKLVANGLKEIKREVEGYADAVRARTGSSGSDAPVVRRIAPPKSV